jgi:hypothetical protein
METHQLQALLATLKFIFQIMLVQTTNLFHLTALLKTMEQQVMGCYWQDCGQTQQQ